MNILVDNFDNTIVDAGRDYVQKTDCVETYHDGTSGPVYATLNSSNSTVVDVPSFTYDQKTDGGKYKYVDGEVVEA